MRRGRPAATGAIRSVAGRETGHLLRAAARPGPRCTRPDRPAGPARPQIARRGTSAFHRHHPVLRHDPAHLGRRARAGCPSLPRWRHRCVGSRPSRSVLPRQRRPSPLLGHRPNQLPGYRPIPRLAHPPKPRLADGRRFLIGRRSASRRAHRPRRNRGRPRRNRGRPRRNRGRPRRRRRHSADPALRPVRGRSRNRRRATDLWTFQAPRRTPSGPATDMPADSCPGPATSCRAVRSYPRAVPIDGAAHGRPPFVGGWWGWGQSAGWRSSCPASAWCGAGWMTATQKGCSAATYSPTRSPGQYHRR
jgi:hypothetical protein